VYVHCTSSSLETVLQATAALVSVHCAGVLLGAGSFARVYKGKWSGLDVAVKVGTAQPYTLNPMARWSEEHCVADT
jgi:hypothetical protein